jgi:hypothetical protein
VSKNHQKRIKKLATSFGDAVIVSTNAMFLKLRPIQELPMVGRNHNHLTREIMLKTF